jgi:hypothetical protein
VSVFLQPIYTQTVGAGGASSISFNNIPQTFTDLYLEVSARDTYSAIAAQAYIRPNGDGASNYSMTFLEGSGSSASSYRFSGYQVGIPGNIPGSTATSNVFSNNSYYISNYTSSNYKQIISETIVENNGTNGYQDLSAVLWQNTAAISSIVIPSATLLVQYSKFSLYGILRQGI